MAVQESSPVQPQLQSSTMPEVSIVQETAILQKESAKDTKAEFREAESGYASGSSEYGASSTGSLPEIKLPEINLTRAHIDFLNAQLEGMDPMEILRFAKILFPNLYQSTAFGLTGLVTIDMLSKLQNETPGSPGVDLIFLDTLYHFTETYDLVRRVQERYPHLTIHTFKPYGVQNVDEFEAMYGAKLYETDGDLYDWTAKVEPLQRSYEDLNVVAILTGRRRSQGGDRNQIPIIELDEERGIIKINPLVNWSFPKVQAYIRENNVPYNALLDNGYKSVGDWHSTSPVAEGEDERAGRWKGQSKTECGIHNKKSKYTQYLEDLSRKAPKEERQPLAVA